MSNGVEFEGESYSANRQRLQSNFSSGQEVSSSKLVRWLITKGIVSSERAAQILLLVVVILNIIVTFFVIKYFL